MGRYAGVLAAYYPNESQAKLEEFQSYQEDPNISFEGWVKENIDNQYRAYVMGWDSVEQVRSRTATFAAHPDPELYLSSSSPHPIETYGCTVCHEGRGHAVEFTRVYHTPRTPEQAADWKEKYEWHKPKYWDWPQLPVDHVTGSCAKCHDSEIYVSGADSYNEGRELMEQSGCYGCHRIEGVTGEVREAGPSLARIKSKISEEFAASWIWNPRNFRPSTKMPHFFGNTNNSPVYEEADGTLSPLACGAEDPVVESLCSHEQKTEQELRGIVAYLFDTSDSYRVQQSPSGGDRANGKRLFTETGCLACHSMESEGWTVSKHGPDLSGVGSKLSKDFIYSWIRDPKRYWEKTRMPSLRLTSSEANDIASYLSSNKRAGWTPIPVKPRDGKIQDAILTEALGGSMPVQELNTFLGGLSPEDKEKLVGQKAIGKYGCAGCHAIKGFDAAGPVGPELSTFYSKTLHALDFALQHDIEHTKNAWIKAHLQNPRRWDVGKIKNFGELQKMPRFDFTDEQIHSLVTYLASRTNRVLPQDRLVPKTPEYIAVQAGRRIARDKNCWGCHYFDNNGGAFAQYWELDDTGRGQFKSAKGDPHFDYLTDVPGPVRGHVPPLLLTQGDKTRPEWLFGFLNEPVMLRPQLKMRMPSFGFSDDDANTVLAYFAGLEGHGVGAQSSYAPSASLVDVGEKLFAAGRCTQCHMNVDRPVKAGEAPPNVVAPNLRLATQRLQPNWIKEWMRNPQKVMPGANMPNYFDFESNYTALDNDGTLLGKDMEKGLNAIRDYLVHSGKDYQAAPLTPRKKLANLQN